QTFTLPVLQNAPPKITSTAVTTAALDTTYEYDVAATDPNSEDVAELVYSFASSVPSGMTIDAETGEIEWEIGTSSALLGVYTIGVKVPDPAGAWDLQQYALRVSDPGAVNGPPVITSDLSRDKLQVGQRLLHQVVAVDPDGDALTYDLVNEPIGMRIDS